MARSLPSVLCLLLVSGCAASDPSPAHPGSAAASPAGAAATDGAANGAPRADGAPSPLLAPVAAADAAPAAWYPAELLTGPSLGGPGLFLSAEPGAPAIGYISAGVVVEIAGAAQSGRIPVRVRGAMRTRGYLPLDRLYARVTQRGRLDDTPLYVGPNDVVRVIGPVDATTMRVEATVPMRPGAEPGPSYVGTFPTASLGGRELPVAPGADAPGTPVGSSEPVPIFDRPGGSLVLTVAPGTGGSMRLAAQREGWSAVLVGDGPYVAGYTQAPLTPVPEPARASSSAPNAQAAGAVSTPVARLDGAVPGRLSLEPDLPLLRLPAGTRVVFNGVTIASLDQPGYARELARHAATGELDVFVAVNDDLAVRGMIAITEGSPQ